MKTVATHPTPLQDLVPGTRDHQDLPELWTPLHILSLLQQVGADPSGGLPEELGYVENAKTRGGPEPSRQIRVGDVQASSRRDAERLEIENARAGVSQSSPRAGTWFRNSGSDSCSPNQRLSPRNRSDRRSVVQRGGGAAGQLAANHA